MQLPLAGSISGATPMPKQIPLTRGAFTVVDDSDYPELSKYKWYAAKCNGGLYAARRKNKNEGFKLVYMHREIMNAPPDKQVDHHDNDSLNNQRYNLRLATPTQNMANRFRPSNNTSGHKGVYWCKARNKWIAQVVIGDEKVNLGGFLKKDDAIAMRNKKAREIYGEFVCPDFTPKLYSLAAKEDE
jgi:hypothetical protein